MSLEKQAADVGYIGAPALDGLHQLQVNAVLSVLRRFFWICLPA